MNFDISGATFTVGVIGTGARGLRSLGVITA